MVNGIVVEILKMHCMIRRYEFNASHGMIMPVGAIQLVQNSELIIIIWHYNPLWVFAFSARSLHKFFCP